MCKWKRAEEEEEEKEIDGEVREVGQVASEI